MGNQNPDAETEYDPANYNHLSTALRNAPAEYDTDRVLDHFDPVVDGGHEYNDDDADESEYKQGRADAVDAGAKIRAKLRRSTGTREHDELVIEGRGADADEAADDFEAALSRAEAGDYTERLRSVADDFKAETED